MEFHNEIEEDGVECGTDGDKDVNIEHNEDEKTNVKGK